MSVDTAPGTSEVIVKFTAQYSGLYMVVMGRVHGEMAWHVRERGERLTYDVYKDIRDAIALLHSNNFVFGDLHTPNIMIIRSGSDAKYHGMLIDFDWVGVHGKAHDLAMLTKLEEQCQSV